MGPLVNGSGRVAAVLGAEGEQDVGIIPRLSGKPSQTVLWRKLINVIVGVKVNAAQSNVANFKLSITLGCDFGGQVVLPAIGKVRVELDTLSLQHHQG